MADRTVTVRLRAIVSDFRRQMGQAGRDVQKVQGRVTEFAEKHQQLGRAAVMGGAAVVAGLGAAGMAANDYQKELDKMVGLVGVSREQTEKWSDELIRLGPEVGKSPRELARAMFFVTSAGFDGAEAMEVLTASAKASAAGLGETETVADAVTSAINAYGKENLSASDATDILTATVREGKLEASELAPQLGQLIPIANELGIEFHEVGGVLATMSRTSGDASKSATALRGIMSKLIKPSEQGKDTLEQFGLTAEGVAAQVRNEGLVPTLRMLQETFGDNSEAMGKVFEDVEGLTGVLNLLGQDAATVDEVMSGVANSAGATDTAFEETRKGVEQFKAGLEAIVLTIGNEVAPMLDSAGKLTADLASKFASLPAPVRKAIALFTGAAGIGSIIAGAMILAIPRIAETIRVLRSLGDTALVTSGKLGRGAGLAAKLGIASLAASTLTNALADLVGYDRDMEGLADSLEAFGRHGLAQGAWRDTIGGVDGLARGLDDLFDRNLWENVAVATSRTIDFAGQVASLGMLDVRGTAVQLEQNFKRVDDALTSLVESGNADEAEVVFRRIAAAAAEQGVALKTVEAAFPGYVDAMAVAKAESADAAEQAEIHAAAERAKRSALILNITPTKNAASETKTYTERLKDAVEEAGNLSDALRAQTDPVFAVMDAISQAEEAQHAYDHAVSEHGKTSKEAKQAAVEHAKAIANLEAEAVRGDLSFRDFQVRLKNWVKQGRITQAEAREVERRVKGVREEANRVPDEVSPDVSAPGAGRSKNQLSRVDRAARRIPERAWVDTRTPGSEQAIRHLQKINDLIGTLPGFVGVEVSASGDPVGDGPGFGQVNYQGSAMATARAAAAGLPVRMSSGYRSPAHNASVGGSPTSFHMDKSNPASDWVGPAWALDLMNARLPAGREKLWRTAGHYDHLHYAHQGGRITRRGVEPLKPNEFDVRAKVGEAILTRRQMRGLRSASAVSHRTVNRTRNFSPTVNVYAQTNDAHDLARRVHSELRKMDEALT